MEIIQNFDEFNTIIHSNDFVLIYVSSENCSVCKADHPIVQDIVNEAISLGLKVSASEMSLEESANAGAIGLFEDKYKDVVRVVNIGDGYSVELCGGTHVSTTSDIQMLKIISESSVAAGVRRIEAITGRKVYNLLKDNEDILSNISNDLKVDKPEISSRINLLQKDIKKTIPRISDRMTKAHLQYMEKQIEDIFKEEMLLE